MKPTRMMRTALLALNGIFAAQAAHAFDDGNELLQALTTESRRTTAMLFIKGAANGLADGYMLGVISVNKAIKPSDAIKGIGYCVPENASVGQVADVVQKYLNSHPENRHFPANALISFAMKDAFPCRK